MRHRRAFKKLGRTSKHRQAMLRNMACSLVSGRVDGDGVKGVVTTIDKARALRPFVEKCISIAVKGIAAKSEADGIGFKGEIGSDSWHQWRSSEDGSRWQAANKEYVTAWRRAVQILCDKKAVGELFYNVAPRCANRPGGYCRILRLANWRIGDAGTKARIELVDNMGE